MDEVTGQIVCGVDLVKKKATTNNEKVKPQDPPPTMVMSEFDSKGILMLTYNKPMDFSFLMNTVSSKNLKSKSGGQSSGFSAQASADSTIGTNFDKNKYLLSSKHLKISMKPSEDQDDSKLQFEWFAVNISETQIKI